MKLKSFSLLSAVAVAMCVSGCSRQADSNTLVVYAAGPRELADWTCQQFEKESGCHTKLFSATTGEIMAKLEAEQSHPQADVVILASPTAAEVLKDEKALAPLPDGLPARTEWTDPDGFYSGIGACALGVAMRKDNAVPQLTWDDVFAGNLPGSMIMPSPEQSGTSSEFVIAFDLAMGEKFWTGLKTIKAHGLQVSGPNSQALTGLVLKAHDAVLASADYLVFKQIEKGEPLVMIFPAPACPVIPRPIAILKGTSNEALAEKFVRFCFSPVVQSQTAVVHLIPADPSVALSALRQASGTLVPMAYDVAKSMADQRPAMKRFRDEIEQGNP